MCLALQHLANNGRIVHKRPLHVPNIIFTRLFCLNTPSFVWLAATRVIVLYVIVFEKLPSTYQKRYSELKRRNLLPFYETAFVLFVNGFLCL